MRTSGWWVAAALFLGACTGEKTGIEKEAAPSPKGVELPGQGKAELGLMLESSCTGGDPESCFQLAKSKLGGTQPDIVGARTAYSRACNVHHGASCYELGKMVRDAKGGPKDPRRAVDVLGIACNEGLSDACVDQAVLLYDGSLTTKPDPGRAVALFQPACGAEAFSALACSRLARAYVEGQGVEKADEKQARTLFEKACATNDPASCVAFGKWLVGQKPKEDIIAGAAALEKACTADPHFGCYELAGLHGAEKPILPEASAVKAADYYQRTCNIDPTRGCFEAADLMDVGKVPARKEEIQSLYNLACEHGSADACTRRSPD